MNFFLVYIFYHRPELVLDGRPLVDNLVFNLDPSDAERIDLFENLCDVWLVNDEKFRLYTS